MQSQEKPPHIDVTLLETIYQTIDSLSRKGEQLNGLFHKFRHSLTSKTKMSPKPTTHFTSIQNLAVGQFRTTTLPLIFGQMLTELETRYGARDRTWTLLGIEFGADGPQNWFPFYPNGDKFILIELYYNALSDAHIACYQLAHECVHLLAPNGKGGAPVIEEGLATVYSEDYVKVNFNRSGFTSMESYKRAAALVRELESKSPDAIRKLREIEPSFKSMTPDTFEKARVEVADDLIEKLLVPFKRS